MVNNVITNEETDAPILTEEEARARTQMMVGIPLGLRLAMREYGAAQDPKWTEAKVAREAIAGLVGYELPKQAERTSTKMSDEEKKARQKEKNKERRQNIASLLAKFSDAPVGDEDEDDEDD